MPRDNREPLIGFKKNDKTWVQRTRPEGKIAGNIWGFFADNDPKGVKEATKRRGKEEKEKQKRHEMNEKLRKQARTAKKREKNQSGKMKYTLDDDNEDREDSEDSEEHRKGVEKVLEWNPIDDGGTSSTAG
ncbi:Fc.00g100470.m01.CDS01 [Cosmosporella sp. VM-42]